MKTDDVLRAVGGMRALCSMLNCRRSAVYQWGEIVPEARQYELEVKTGGVLISDYTRSKASVTKNVTSD